MQMRAGKTWLLGLVLLGRAAFSDATVFVLEFPGASGQELERLLASGALNAGGFSRCLREGKVAFGIRVSNPTLPAVGRELLLRGGVGSEPFSSWKIPGGEVPDSHLLVELARSGRRVGSVLWPGLEAIPAEAKPEWGLMDQESQEYAARIQEILRRGWTDEKYGEGPGPSRLWNLPPTIQSFSRPLTVGFPFLRPHDWAKHRLDLVAIDRTDDGVENYDALLVSTDRDPKKGFVGLLEPGRWLEFPLPTQGLDRRSVPQWARLRLLQFDPLLERTLVYAAPVAFLRPHPSRLLELLGGSSWIWPGKPEGEVLLGEAWARFGRGSDVFAESVERFATEALRASAMTAKEFRTDLMLLSISAFDALDRYAPLVDPEPGGAQAQLRREVWQALDRALATWWPWLDLERDHVLLLSTSSSGVAHQLVDLWQLLKPILGGKSLPGSIAVEGATLRVRLKVAGRDSDGTLVTSEARKLLRSLQRALSATRDGSVVVFPAVTAQLAKGDGWDLVASTRNGYLLAESGRGTEVLQRLAPPQRLLGMAAETSPIQGFVFQLGRGVATSSKAPPPSLEQLHFELRKVLGLAEGPLKSKRF